MGFGLDPLTSFAGNDKASEVVVGGESNSIKDRGTGNRYPAIFPHFLCACSVKTYTVRLACIRVVLRQDSQVVELYNSNTPYPIFPVRSSEILDTLMQLSID